MFVLEDNGRAPTLEISAKRDLVSGWNLYIKTDNFQFAPENASGPHVTGEGHAHILINDVKVARVYSSWFYVDKLAKGMNTVTVTLNTNDHRQLIVSGKPLSASVLLDTESK